MDVEITTINQMSLELKKEIDIFIEKNKYSTIFHTTYWNNILIRNFADNMSHYYLICTDGEEIIYLFSYFVNSRFKLYDNLYSPFGGYETPYGGHLVKDSNTKFNLVELVQNLK